MIAIHEVAKETGISVRTLRYYEEIGLLHPSAKTEGGHRLYGEEELKKLQHIVFMKSLGFRLKEIQSLLENEWNWPASLEHQLAYIVAEQEKLREMERAIRGVQHALAIEGEVNEEFLQMMIKLSGRDHERKHAFRKQAFTDCERGLLQGLPNLNHHDPDSLEWMGLLGQLMKLKEHDPDSYAVQGIIGRMMEKATEDYGEQQDFLDKMWEIRKSPSQSAEAGLYPLSPQFLQFIERAFDLYEARQKKGGRRA